MTTVRIPAPDRAIIGFGELQFWVYDTGIISTRGFFIRRIR
jgi:hypothetical protein